MRPELIEALELVQSCSADGHLDLATRWLAGAIENTDTDLGLERTQTELTEAILQAIAEVAERHRDDDERARP